jgi:hypothetical protein
MHNLWSCSAIYIYCLPYSGLLRGVSWFKITAVGCRPWLRGSGWVKEVCGSACGPETDSNRLLNAQSLVANTSTARFYANHPVFCALITHHWQLTATTFLYRTFLTAAQHFVCGLWTESSYITWINFSLLKVNENCCTGCLYVWSKFVFDRVQYAWEPCATDRL